jgi:hypothetical protein
MASIFRVEEKKEKNPRARNQREQVAAVCSQSKCFSIILLGIPSADWYFESCHVLSDMDGKHFTMVF